MKSTFRILLVTVVAACGWSAAAALADTPITTLTPGDLVVLRGGDATNPNTATTTTQVALYLDEYTTAGLYVGTINVPSAGQTPLTIPGIGDFQHEGLLSLSTNGQFLTFAGYQATVGSADAFTQLGAGASAPYQPVIGEIGKTAASLTTNTVVNAYGAGSTSPFIRGAVTNDGQEFWAFGKFAATGATSNGGLTYISGTGTTATTTTIEGFADWRDIVAAGGQLYGGTGSSSVGAHGPYQISTGEPTTNLGASLANNTQLGAYPGGQSASALALLKLPDDPNSQNGVNVLYTIGDQSTPGIVKYFWDGTTWENQTDVALNATNVVNPTGLIAMQDPANSSWVDLTVSGTNGFYTYIDKSDYNGTISANAFTLAASAPANEAFYGIAQVPSAVPEPATAAWLCAGATGLLLRRRRK